VTNASVQALQHGRVVTTARTDSAGGFRLALTPGGYTILATNPGGYTSTAQRDVSVRAGKTATVDLVVDSGIR